MHGTVVKVSPSTNDREHAAIIYNPVKVDLPRLRAIVAEREAKHAWGDSIWLATTEDDPGEGMAREALERGAKLVIACGGDGTVRSVAAGVRNSRVPMGIIPLGTGNLLARNLNLPIDNIDRAVAIALGGTNKMVDIGIVTYTMADTRAEHSEVFLVMIGVGLDAELIAGTDENLKSKVGWLAYIKAFATSVLTGHRIKVRYSLDDEDLRDIHCRSIIVGNCGSLQAGVVLLPDAQLADGKLDLVALRPKGPSGWLRLAYAVVVQNTVLARLGVPPARTWADKMSADLDRAGQAWADLLGRENSRRFTAMASRRRQRWSRLVTAASTFDNRQGKTVSLYTADDPVKFQIDGDDIGDITELHIQVKHLALALRLSARS